jgi:hypothetical protein
MVASSTGLGPENDCTGMSQQQLYAGESNENRKTEIKIRNIAPLSYKLADMLPVL